MTATLVGILLVVFGFMSQNAYDKDGKLSQVCDGSPWTWVGIAGGLFMLIIGFASVMKTHKTLKSLGGAAIEQSGIGE